MKVPAYDDLGKEIKELLSGRKTGVFQYDQKLTVNLKAASGVSIAAKAIRSPAGGRGLDTEFKGTWKHGPVTVEALPAIPKATIKSAFNVAPGLTVTVSDELPNPDKRAKATIDYFQPHVASTFVVGLNSALPIDVTAAVGYNGFVVGGKASVDVRRSALNSYAASCAYLGPNFVATGHMTGMFEKITGTYWQKVDSMSSVAAEVVHNTSSNDVALTMGYSRIEADGTLNKMKISSKGAVQVHRDFKLSRDTTVGVSVSVNALDMTEQPAVGVSVDYTP